MQRLLNLIRSWGWLFWELFKIQWYGIPGSPKWSLSQEFKNSSLLALSSPPQTQVGKILGQSWIEGSNPTGGGGRGRGRGFSPLRRLSMGSKNHLGIELWFKYFRNWLDSPAAHQFFFLWRKSIPISNNWFTRKLLNLNSFVSLKHPGPNVKLEVHRVALSKCLSPFFKLSKCFITFCSWNSCLESIDRAYRWTVRERGGRPLFSSLPAFVP